MNKVVKLDGLCIILVIFVCPCLHPYQYNKIYNFCSIEFEETQFDPVLFIVSKYSPYIHSLKSQFYRAVCNFYAATYTLHKTLKPGSYRLHKFLSQARPKRGLSRYRPIEKQYWSLSHPIGMQYYYTMVLKAR